ncbi:hypothetical protein LguiB_026398 [Lonicera macranthoides]
MNHNNHQTNQQVSYVPISVDFEENPQNRHCAIVYQTPQVPELSHASSLISSLEGGVLAASSQHFQEFSFNLQSKIQYASVTVPTTFKQKQQDTSNPVSSGPLLVEIVDRTTHSVSPMILQAHTPTTNPSHPPVCYDYGQNNEVLNAVDRQKSQAHHHSPTLPHAHIHSFTASSYIELTHSVYTASSLHSQVLSPLRINSVTFGMAGLYLNSEIKASLVLKPPLADHMWNFILTILLEQDTIISTPHSARADPGFFEGVGCY